MSQAPQILLKTKGSRGYREVIRFELYSKSL